MDAIKTTTSDVVALSNGPHHRNEYVDITVLHLFFFSLWQTRMAPVLFPHFSFTGFYWVFVLLMPRASAYRYHRNWSSRGQKKKKKRNENIFLFETTSSSWDNALPGHTNANKKKKKRIQLRETDPGPTLLFN